MFTVKNTWFLVTFIVCVSYVRAEVKSEKCDNRYKIPEWLSPSSTDPAPAKLNRVKVSPSQAVQEIAVRVSKIQDNVTLSLLARPFVKSEDDCRLPAKEVYRELAKSVEEHDLSAGTNEYETKYFHRVFTGCYYFELTNSMNHKWIWDGFFFNSTIQYNDTKVGCDNIFVDASSDESMKLTYKLTIGMTCFKLRCRLYELATNDTDTLIALDNEDIPPSQECNITYSEHEMRPSIHCLNSSDRSLTLSLDSVTIDERGRWTTVVTWKNLKEGGAFYYSHLGLFNHRCDMDDHKAWRPAVELGAIIHGYKNGNSRLPSKNTNKYTYIIGIGTGIIIMIMLVYWLVRYAKIMVQRRHVFVDLDTKTEINVEDSDEILLIYARGSPQFMKKMEEFRSHLQNTCGSRVHDVYSPDDFPELARVGVSDWVMQRLSGGSKVVWVDTPHFRSLFNGEPRPNTDFRDNAIPYAVKIATDLFLDPATQYCRHFVVRRMESLQVEKGHADPLLVISPHKRYYIPQHLDKLCAHLTKRTGD